ncbi:MAG: Slp family lipoprotein [Deltaproteobacteria bacterium]|nr:Slp family lipoprotein [Deltaproteobacteria bacterium]
MNSVKILASVIMLALLSGCAPVISENVLKTVDRSIEFKAVAADPARYIGKSVVFGGTIIRVENFENITVMEVVQEGLNSQLKPVAQEESAGRFLVRFKEFKDPAIFSAGKHITVAGVVTGTETRPLGKATYRYPVLEPEEHYLWEPSDYDRGRTSVGIGIGFGF